MLWINLVMDTLAGLAFGGERPREEYMCEPPKRRDEKIINKYMWNQILFGAMFTGFMSLLFLTSNFMQNLLETRGPIYFRSAFFAFFMLMNIFNAFNARSHDLNVFHRISTNRPFIWIMGIVAVVQILMVYFGGAIFRTMPLDAIHLVMIILVATLVFPYEIGRKFFTESHKGTTT